MTAVCEDSGGVDRWSPDPGDLSCSQPGPAVIGKGTVLCTVTHKCARGIQSYHYCYLFLDPCCISLHF